MSKIQNPTKVIAGVNTRWNYANVWNPKSINGSAPKYSISLIIPKNDTVTINKLKAAIQAVSLSWIVHRFTLVCTIEQVFISTLSTQTVIVALSVVSTTYRRYAMVNLSVVSQELRIISLQSTMATS